MVGIGASAGGLEAMKELLSALPLNTEMAIPAVFAKAVANHGELYLFNDVSAKSKGHWFRR